MRNAALAGFLVLGMWACAADEGLGAGSADSLDSRGRGSDADDSGDPGDTGNGEDTTEPGDGGDTGEGDEPTDPTDEGDGSDSDDSSGTGACPADRTVVRGTSTTLEPALDGTEVECQWRVLVAPVGSRAIPGTGCAPDFTPDLVGDYVLELLVIHDDDSVSQCETRVRATPPPSLYVETSWDQAGDIDLHVLNEALANAEDASSWFSAADCYYGHRNPGWAVHEEDVVAGTGVERVLISAREAHGYAVAVQNWSNARTPVTITTDVFCDGAQIASVTTVTNQTREFFVLGRVDDSCGWTPLDLQLNDP